MPFHSLKFKIAADLAVIVLITTLLSYFVVIHIVQKNLIQNGVEQGRRLMAELPERNAADGEDAFKRWTGVMDARLRDSPYIYAAFHSVAGKEYDTGVIPNDLKKPLRQQSAQVARTRQSHILFCGDTWGVFWHQIGRASCRERV